MPELPEVETVRRILAPEVVGQTISGVTLHDFPAVLTSIVPGIDPRTTLPGSTISGVDRRGKYLLLHLDSTFTLIVHLRMTGRLLLRPTTDQPVRFEHLAIHFANGTDLRFGDQRKFGRVTLADEDAVAALDRKLGPEPFARSLTPEWLGARLARRPGKIKNALLDQRLIAGLGNIYVDEALYRVRIHPEHPSHAILIADLGRLIRAVRLVLNQSLLRQGTTFSTFENPYGEQGDNAAYLKVYGQGGKGGRCPRCGTAFARIVVGGRGTSFCPRCQVVPDTQSADAASRHPGAAQ